VRLFSRHSETKLGPEKNDAQPKFDRAPHHQNQNGVLNPLLAGHFSATVAPVANGFFKFMPFNALLHHNAIDA
jgi:hypothetical protein